MPPKNTKSLLAPTIGANNDFTVFIPAGASRMLKIRDGRKSAADATSGADVRLAYSASTFTGWRSEPTAVIFWPDFAGGTYSAITFT